MKKLLFAFCLFLTFVACDPTGKGRHKDDAAANDTIPMTRMDSVIAIISDSIAADSTNSNLYLHRARAYVSNEQVGMAMMDVNKSISLNPRNIDAYLLLSDLYYLLGDDANITSTLTKAADLDPQDARPLVKLAELSLLQQNFKLTKGYLDKALAINNYNPNAYFVKGMMFVALHDTTTALKNFMIARDQDDAFFDPVHEICNIYVAQHNPLAEGFLRDAVRKFPYEASIRYELALFIQDEINPEEALKHYDTLLMTQPDSARLFFNKGYVYFVGLNDNKNALDYFNRALACNPDYVDALYNKGRVLEQMGNYSQAMDIYGEVLKRKPDYKLAIDAINRVQNQSAE